MSSVGEFKDYLEEFASHSEQIVDGQFVEQINYFVNKLIILFIVIFSYYLYISSSPV